MIAGGKYIFTRYLAHYGRSRVRDVRKLEMTDRNFIRKCSEETTNGEIRERGGQPAILMKPLEKKRIAMHGKLARFNCRSQTSYMQLSPTSVFMHYMPFCSTDFGRSRRER